MAETKTAVNPPVLNEEDLRQGMELLFFAYRDFTARSDAILAKKRFGRAHHRVIYFVGRRPGMTVSTLLAILGITKQSLSRVLSQLLREDYIVQETGADDRRQRLLFLSAKGRAFEHELTSEQCARLAAAYRRAGPAAVDGFRKVMLDIMDSRSRGHFQGSGP